MTISSETRRAGPFLGNSVTTAFPFSFKIFDKTDIKLLLVDANGVARTLTLDSDYSVALGANQDQNPGGTITYPLVGNPMPAPYSLVILGNLSYLQPTDITNNGGFYPKVISDMVDRATIQIQQVEENVSRAIVFTEAETTSPVLPNASARAGTVLGFDDLGGVELLPVPASVGAGDLRIEEWADGVDYTAGTSTTVTLSRLYGTKANLGSVVMQGVAQDPASYSLTGNSLVFDAVIPVGVSKIWCTGGTTLSVYSPPDSSVTDAKVAANAGISSSKLAYNQGTGTAFTRTVESRLREIISAKDFCVGDGVADDTAGFNQFLAELQKGAGEGYIPDGTYALDNYMVVDTAPITLRGSQRAILQNMNSALSAPLLHVTAAASVGTELTGFTLSSAGLLTPAAAGLQYDSGRDFTIRDITISGFYRGMFLSGAQFGGTVDGCFVTGATEDAYLIFDGNLSLVDCYAVNNGGKGFDFMTTAGSAGITMTNCTAFNNTNGNFAFFGSSGAIIQDVYLANCVASSTTNGDGYLFDTYGKNIQLVGCFSENAGASDASVVANPRAGFHFTPNNHRVTLTGCQASFSGGPGAQMDCGYFSIAGGDYTANGIYSYGTYPGVLVGSVGAVSNFTITGVNTVPEAVLDVNSQSYGVSLGVTGSSAGTVVGCVLGGLTGAIGNLTGNSVTVQGNAGYINEASGVVTVPAGQTSASVTHGMNVTPASVVTSVGDASGPTGLVASSGTPSSFGFTVWLSSTSGTPINVNWYARAHDLT